jgi:cell division protein FtsQ
VSATRAAAHPSPWRWLRRGLLAVLVLVTLAFFGQWILHRSFFSVQHVRVSGATHETRAEILAVTGLGAHPAMIDVHSSAVAHDLDALPWVASAKVVLRWPDTVTIAVTERVPVAVAYGAKGHLYLVDDTGDAIARVTETRSFPLLTALGATAGTWPYQSWASAAARVAGELPVAFQEQVATVEISRTGDVTLLMTTPVTFDLGAPTQLHQKFVAAAAMLASPRLLHTCDTVDLSVPNSPTVSGPQ